MAQWVKALAAKTDVLSQSPCSTLFRDKPSSLMSSNFHNCTAGFSYAQSKEMRKEG